MSKTLQQLAALTAIRKLVEKEFPRQDFYYMENQLTDWIELAANEEIAYDESRQAYILKMIPLCKVCQAVTLLVEIQTVSGSFHICKKCMHDIASAQSVG